MIYWIHTRDEVIVLYGRVDIMSNKLPFLEIIGPDGQVSKVYLSKDRLTIGRFSEFNDVALEPDPQQLISRKVHCAIEREGGAWWIVDNGSINRTFIKRDEAMSMVEGRARLSPSDIICILGKLTEDGTPIYWKLNFEDPWSTQVPKRVILTPHIEYDWLQAKLYRIIGTKKDEIKNLSPQEHKLVRYMDQRNRSNGNVPVMCAYEELIEAIWGDEVDRTESEVNHLIWRLRKKVEDTPGSPQFFQNVQGLGYRLETKPQFRYGIQ